MRSFIFGLLIGGFAVHLLHRASQSRSGRSRSTRAHAEPPATRSEPRVELHTPPVLAATVPASAAPNYQPARLDQYTAELQTLAEQLFVQTASLTGQSNSHKEDDGYSFRSDGGGTAARIIIYQRHHGTESGPFPMLHDGVYVLLRASGSAPNTLGIGSTREERFNYRRVNEINLDDVAHEISDLLHVADAVLR